MFQFRCPTCKSTIAAPEEMAGEKVSCQRCGQRLMVPTPQNQTVLGEALEWAPSRPVASTTVPVEPCPACGRELSVTPELIGRWVSCQCGAEFAATRAGEPDTEDEYTAPSAAASSRAIAYIALLCGLVMGGLLLVLLLSISGPQS